MFLLINKHEFLYNEYLNKYKYNLYANFILMNSIEKIITSHKTFCKPKINFTFKVHIKI